ERQVEGEGEEALFVAVLLEEGEAEVEGERDGAEALDVEADAEAGGDAVVAEAGIVGDGAGIDEDDAGDHVLPEGLLELGPVEEAPGAADGVVAERAGVVPDALGGDGAVVEAAEGAPAEVEALVDGDGGLVLGGVVEA